jgi:hypothetical protein
LCPSQKKEKMKLAKVDGKLMLLPNQHYHHMLRGERGRGKIILDYIEVPHKITQMAIWKGRTLDDYIKNYETEIKKYEDLIAERKGFIKFLKELKTKNGTTKNFS